ncbi:hypothetical protein CR513_10891, partial [Mucuna pruriens]
MHYLKEIARIYGELSKTLETKIKIDYKLPYVIRQNKVVVGGAPIFDGVFFNVCVMQLSRTKILTRREKL